MNDEKTFLLELREQAQQEWRPLHRALLRDWADEIDYVIKELAKSPTRKNLARLNSYWARAWRVLVQSQERPEPEPPLAGSPEVFAGDMEEAA